MGDAKSSRNGECISFTIVATVWVKHSRFEYLDLAIQVGWVHARMRMSARTCARDVRTLAW